MFSNTLTTLALHLRLKRVFQRAGVLAALFLCLTSLNCQTQTSPNKPGAGVPNYGYQVVHVFPHDPDAFTQGLVFHDGKLLESTGEEGRSSRSEERRVGKECRCRCS